MASLLEQFRRYKSAKERRLYQAGAVLLGEMQNLVAEKTYRLEDSLRLGEFRQDSPTRFTLEVGSFGVPYAPIVEYGVQGRVYNYHRYAGAGREVVYVGVGQSWRARSIENKRAEIVNILSS